MATASGAMSHKRLDAAAQFRDAATRGDLSTCEAALRENPKILEMCDSRGTTALIAAARAGQFDVCDRLLVLRADVEATDIDDMTPLSYASRGTRGPDEKRFRQTCRVLLDHGADIEATDCIVRDMGCSLL